MGRGKDASELSQLGGERRGGSEVVAVAGKRLPSVRGGAGLWRAAELQRGGGVRRGSVRLLLLARWKRFLSRIRQVLLDKK